MDFRFDAYDVKELETCGELFGARAVAHDEQNPRCSTARWTDLVLGFFEEAAPDDVLVDARRPRAKAPVLGNSFAPKNTAGEFLVDLAHSTYPRYSKAKPYSSGAWWDEALGGPCRVRLALESEWGKAGSPGSTRVAVLQDAIKLAAFRANAKVMVFGSQGDNRTDIVRDLALLRSRSGDRAPWLWIDVPWKLGKDGLRVDWGVLARGTRRASFR